MSSNIYISSSISKAATVRYYIRPQLLNFVILTLFQKLNLIKNISYHNSYKPKVESNFYRLSTFVTL
jgi:hypothetical protein